MFPLGWRLPSTLIPIVVVAAVAVTPLFADAQSVAGEEECGVCDVCWIPDLGEMGHNAVQARQGQASTGVGWHFDDAGEPGSCLPGTCDDEHPFDPSCVDGGSDAGSFAASVLGPDLLPVIWEGIKSGVVDPESVVSFSANVQLNPARGAIQVFGCDGLVVAHLPLPSGRDPWKLAGGSGTQAMRGR
jgi:hypothetical protein